MDLTTVIWLLVFAQFFVPLIQKRLLEARRYQAIQRIERMRGSRVITLIHRQETMSFLGFPISRYIDIEDSEVALRAIRLTPPEMPIDLILHTPGGLVLASEQPNPNRDDHTLILGDLARKAQDQVVSSVERLLLEHQTPEDARRIAHTLGSGRWTHDYPISVEEARELGLPVSTQMPMEMYDLMALYPQTSQRRPGVEFIPVPYLPRPTAPAKEK